MIRVNVQDGNDQILVGADSATLALERAVTEAASAWLGGHITNPSNPPLDTSLLVSGAAADSKAVGDRIAATEAHHDEDMSYIEDADSYNLLDNRAVQVWSGQGSKVGVTVTRTGFNGHTLSNATIANGRVYVRLVLKTNTSYTIAFNKHRDTTKEGSNGAVRIMEWINNSWSQRGEAFTGEDDVWKLYSFTTSNTGEDTVIVRVTFCVTKVSEAQAGDVTWSNIMLLEGDYTGAYVQVPAFVRRRYAEDDAARNLLDVAIASRDEIPAHAGTTADPAFDLDTLVQPGIYFKRVSTPVQHGVNDVNVKSNRRARIIVVSGGTNSLVMQFWQDFTYNELWMRTRYGSSDPWRTWTPLYIVKPNLTSNTDLNDLDYPGLYFKGSSVSVVNGVGDANRIAKILVIGHGSTALNTQFWFDYSSNMLWMRTKKYSGEWADWQQISNYENRYPGAPYSTVADMYTDLDAIESASEGRLTSEVISGVLDGDTSDATNVNRIRLYRLNVQPRYMVTGLNGGYKVVDPDNTEDWEAGTYNEYAQVKHNGSLWGSTANSNTTEPGTSGANWKSISPIFYQKPKAFLIAAQHGDERSNPRIMVDLIQKFLWDDSYAEIAAGFEWYIIPVVNVWGYNHNTRNNADDKNINRDYSKNKFETEEAQAVRDVYFANEFSLFLDIHNYNDNTANLDSPRIGFISLIPPVDTPSDADMVKFQRLWRTCDGVGRSAEAWARNYPNALNTDEQLCYLWGYPDEWTYKNAASAAGYIRGNHTLDPDYAEHHPVLCSATVETGRCAGILSGVSTYFNRVAMSFSTVYVEGMVKALGEEVLAICAEENVQPAPGPGVGPEIVADIDGLLASEADKVLVENNSGSWGNGIRCLYEKHNEWTAHGYVRSNGDRMYPVPAMSVPVKHFSSYNWFQVALTWFNRSNLVHDDRNSNGLFAENCVPVDGKYDFDCSEFVSAVLLGITYDNSRYALGSSADNVQMNYIAYSGFPVSASPDRVNGGLLSNELARLFAEQGLLYRVPEENVAETLQPGDILFWKDTTETNHTYLHISHVGIVIDTIRNYVVVMDSGVDQTSYGYDTPVATRKVSVTNLRSRCPVFARPNYHTPIMPQSVRDYLKKGKLTCLSLIGASVRTSASADGLLQGEVNSQSHLRLAATKVFIPVEPGEQITYTGATSLGRGAFYCNVAKYDEAFNFLGRDSICTGGVAGSIVIQPGTAYIRFYYGFSSGDYILTIPDIDNNVSVKIGPSE